MGGLVWEAWGQCFTLTVFQIRVGRVHDVSFFHIGGTQVRYGEKCSCIHTSNAVTLTRFTPHSAPPLQYNTSPLPSLSAPGFHLTRLKKKKGDLPTYNRSRGCPSSCRYVRREAHPHPLGSCPTCRCRCYCTATSRGSSPPQGPASSYPARLLQAEAPIPTVPLLRPTYRF